MEQDRGEVTEEREEEEVREDGVCVFRSTAYSIGLCGRMNGRNDTKSTLGAEGIRTSSTSPGGSVMVNEGKWADWYQGVEKPWPYGDTTTYEIGAPWLDGCALIEDWGCGAGWLRTLVPPDRYRGIDGTSSPFCDEVVECSAGSGISGSPVARGPG